MKGKLILIGFIFLLITSTEKTYSQVTTDSLSTHNSILLPLITRSIETDWSFGLATIFTFKMNKKDTVSRTSNIEVVGIYSLKKQFVAVINGNQYFKKEQLILTEQFSYSSFPDKFWGIGRNTTANSAEPYTFQQYYLYAHLMKNMGKKLFIGVLAEHQNVLKVDYIANGLFDKDNVAGRNGYKTVGIGFSVTKDTRNHAFTSSKGTFAQVFFTTFSSLLGSSYNFSSLVIDVRKYFPIATTHVLALQAYSLNNIGNEIPLRNLGALGGSNSMRGYYSGRYRDNNLMVLQSEYRLPVYKRFGIVGFASLGNVGNNLADFHLNDIKYSYGGGLRFALSKKEKLNLRIDYGFGKGGNNGLYFQIGEAF
jgi:hypothetical protein